MAQISEICSTRAGPSGHNTGSWIQISLLAVLSWAGQSWIGFSFPVMQGGGGGVGVGSGLGHN